MHLTFCSQYAAYRSQYRLGKILYSLSSLKLFSRISPIPMPTRTIRPLDIREMVSSLTVHIVYDISFTTNPVQVNNISLMHLPATDALVTLCITALMAKTLRLYERTLAAREDVERM